MSSNDADRLLTAWLTSVAPTREPEHLLGAVLEETARTPRRRSWRIPERWIPMATITTRVAPGGRVPWSLVAVGALVALALVAGLMLLAGSRNRHLPAPFGPAANGALVYESNGNLTSVDLATGKRTGITSGAGLEIEPQFSRDGTQLAWLSAADVADLEPHIWTLRVGPASGAGARDLGTFTDVDGYVWSPSGDRIAMASSVGGYPSISMVDVASGKLTLLPIGVPAMQPVFRPADGGQLAFRGKGADGVWGIYLVAADGTGARRLDLDPGFEQDANYGINADYYFFAPAWSPDGGRLAYHTLEESSTGEDPGFRVHVAAIDATGTVTKETTLEPDPAIDDELNPAWLPDGSGLVVQRVEEGAQSLVRWPVSDAPAGGSAVVLGLGTVGSDLRYELAPDGKDVLAWNPGSTVLLVPLSGEPAVPVQVPVADGVSWQRTAP